MQTIEISVVLPVYNEEKSLHLLHAELKSALDALGRSYEIIYVDDGSRDASAERLAELAARDPSVVVIQLRRNYGQTAAISAGIDYSQGELIVLLDADLQNDPADIGRLLAKLDEGYDVVSGWRKHRQDTFISRRLPSILANRLISKVTGVHLHDYGCTLKAYRREVLGPVRLYGEMHRFIPVYAHWGGARITELPVNHRARRFGYSKYGIMRTARVVIDLMTVKFMGSYATKPHYAFGYVGMLLGVASVLAEVLAVVQRLTPPYVRMHNNPLMLFGAVLFVVAVQVAMMGLLAELIMRTYYESQGKSTYAVRLTVLGTDEGIIRMPQYVAADASRVAEDRRRALDSLRPVRVSATQPALADDERRNGHGQRMDASLTAELTAELRTDALGTRSTTATPVHGHNGHVEGNAVN
jgi:glycosyltransferase involved in cell wall biosynthesis